MATSSEQRRGPSGSRSTTVNALIGAVVATVLAFIPFSPVLGGGVAGYLNADKRGSGIRVGALSGVITMIPLILFVGGFVVLFGLGVGIVDVFSGFMATIVVGVLALLFVLATGLYTIGLGALGGYIGVELAAREGGRGVGAGYGPGEQFGGGQSDRYGEQSEQTRNRYDQSSGREGREGGQSGGGQSRDDQRGGDRTSEYGTGDGDDDYRGGQRSGRS